MYLFGFFIGFPDLFFFSSYFLSSKINKDLFAELESKSPLLVFLFLFELAPLLFLGESLSDLFFFDDIFLTLVSNRSLSLLLSFLFNNSFEGNKEFS